LVDRRRRALLQDVCGKARSHANDRRWIWSEHRHPTTDPV